MNYLANIVLLPMYRDYLRWSSRFSGPIEGVNDSCANICKIIFGYIPNGHECKYVHNKLLRKFGCRGMWI